VKTQTALAIGRNVRTQRKAKGWSLHNLARAAGGPAVSTLSELERGQLNPTLGTLEAVAGALDVNVTDLLSEGPTGRWGTCSTCHGEGKVWEQYT